MFTSQKGVKMCLLDAESKGGCVFKTKMVRVRRKLERNILWQRFPYELCGNKTRRASGSRLSLTESQEWLLYL